MTASVIAQYRLPRARITRRNALMMSCAALALASTVAAPRDAYAQAFIGGFSSSDATQQITGSTSETITVTAPTATIDWTASNNDFLPDGNTATFTSDPGITDYTVLNRVTPADSSNPILLNGNVISTLEGTSTIGGNIWFYSPSGIIVGATATFDVGGLLLTSLTPGLFTNDANGFNVSFSRQTGDGGTITILDGAQLNALQQNSYIALVAPRIEQGGSVRVNGSAAYIAAEQMTMEFNQGLFDIMVDVGTDDPNGIVHTGSTGGPSSTGASDKHRIYMAAVPKNQALTMLLSGSIGFDEAASAEIENGRIVLSSGWTPGNDGGTIEYWQTFDTASDAGIHIQGGTFTSPVEALANGNILVDNELGAVSFDDDLSLWSFNADVTLNAFNGLTIDVLGNLNLQTTGGSQGLLSITATGTGSAVNIAGYANLQAQYVGAGAATEGDSANITAGDIFVGAYDGGTVNTGDIYANAYAYGQDNAGGGTGIAGYGQGGQITFTADGGGAINVDGTLYANANGLGGDMLDGSTEGGAGYGGNILLSVYDGSIGVTGNVYLYANGFGGTIGDGGTGNTQTGGTGYGGYSIISSNGPGAITIGGSTDVVADGIGGDGQTGGSAYGGQASIYAYDGTIALGSWIYVSASGWGGSATLGFGGSGGYGEGGYASIEARANPIVELLVPPAGTITGGDAIVASTGAGGDGGAGNTDIAAGAGGDGQGGIDCGECSGGAYVLAQVDGATLSLGSVGVLSEGFGGIGGNGGTSQNGGAGGVGYGGTSLVGFVDPFGTNAMTGSMTFTDLEIRSRGLGGNGGNGTTVGVGGEGDGGEAELLIDGGALTASGDLAVLAKGVGGNGSVGGDGYGGTVSGVITSNGGALVVGGDLNIEAVGQGGDGVNNPDGSGGTAGDGYGGFADLTIPDSLAVGASVSLDFGNAYVRANGLGGDGGNGVTGGDGGDGFGGTASIYQGSGSASSGEFLVSTSSVGGVGGNGSVGAGGAGGDGYGGLTTFTIGGDLTATTIYSLSRGIAGDGGSGTVDGDGGYGEGADASIDVLAGAQLDANIELAANATGGNGGNGGDAFAGSIHFRVEGTLTGGGYVNLDGSGIGGDATNGNGGSGTGGTIDVLVDGGGTMTTGDFELNAQGQGGNGGNDLVGGAGGDGIGGSSAIVVGAGSSLVAADIDSSAIGFGGDGGAGSNGQGGAGGAGYGGSTDLTVDGTLSAASYIGWARAFGGNGGTGTTGAGTGGDAYAGGSSGADGGGSSITVNSTGIVEMTGFFNVNATAFGGDGSSGGSGFGGESQMQIYGSVIADDVEVTAAGFGGEGLSGFGGDGYGGNAQFYVSGSLATQTGFMGNGGYGGNGVLGGGIGDAGTVGLTVDGGSMTIGDNFYMQTWATGGNASNGSGGSAYGGTATFEVSSGGSLTGGDVEITADATGGNGTLGGGDADAGTSTITIDGGTLTAALIGNYANAWGGNALSAGYDGGDATGGDALITFTANGGTLTSGDTQVEAIGFGGDGLGNGFGGDGTGGNASIDATLGAADLGTGWVDGDGYGGDGFAGGAGQGGNASIIVGSTFAAGADYSVVARGFGGDGDATSGTGGMGTGGNVSFDVLASGDATATDMVLTASGTGGDGSTGGNGQGGTSTIDVAGILTVLNYMQSVAQGFGGAGEYGGDGFGGAAYINVIGQLDASELSVRAAGFGGDGTIEAGDGIGGVAFVAVDGGSLTVTTAAEIVSGGFGGSGGTTGIGGNGEGGYSYLQVVNGGSATLNDLNVWADGTGGAGTTEGDGFGGTAMIMAGSVSSVGDTSTLVLTGTTLVSAYGVGGNGSGGTAWVRAQDATTITGETVNIVATGNGTVTGAGGYAFLEANGGTLVVDSATLDASGSSDGGYAELNSISGPSSDGSVTTGSLNMIANGQGGQVVIRAVGGTADLGLASLTATGSNASVIVTAGSSSSSGFGAIYADSMTINSGGSVDFETYNGGIIDVTNTLSADAGGLIAITDDGFGGYVSANTADFNAFNFINNGNLYAINFLLAVAGDLVLGDYYASGNLSLTAGGSLTIGDVVAMGDLALTAGTDLTAGNLDASGDVALTAGEDIVAGYINAGGGIAAQAGGNLTLGALVSGIAPPPPLLLGDFSTTAAVVTGLDVTLSSEGDLTVESIDSAGAISLTAGGTLNSGNLTAATSIAGNSVGNLAVGAVQAHDNITIASSGGNVTTGAVTSIASGITLNANGTLVTGALDAATDIFADSVGNMQITSATANNIDLDSAGNITTGDLTGPQSVDVNAGGSLILGNILAGDLSLTTGTDLTLGNLDAGGDIVLVAANAIVVGDVNAGGGIAADAGTDLTLGNLNASGDVALVAANAIVAGDVNASGGITADAGTNLTLGNLNASGDVALTAVNAIVAGDVNAGGGIAADAGGDLTLGALASGNAPAAASISAAVVTGQDVTLSSGGDLTVESIDSAGAITATAGGTLDTGNLTAVTNITGNSASIMTIGNVQAGGNVMLGTSDGQIQVGSVTSGGEIKLDANGALSTGNLDAATDIFLDSGSDMQIASATAGQQIVVNSEGRGLNVTTGNLAGQTVDLNARGDLSVANVDASTSASFTAGGLANFYGTVASPTITVTSGDIYIDAGGALGVAGLTDLIIFNAVSAGDILLGAGTNSGYHLDEDGDIYADSVVFNAVNGNDVVVGDLQIDGSQTAGGGIGSVTVNTDGLVRVVGDVIYQNAAADDSLILNGGHAIEVITDTGSITMVDSNGDLSGILVLNADNVWVADQALISKLEADPNFAGRDAALATNNGPVVSDGYIRAGAVNSTASDSFFVQNSGTSTSYAGITVGDGGLDITNGGSDPLPVIVYGKQVKSDGTVVSGNNFVQAASVAGTAGATSNSTVNGCPLSGCVLPPDPPEPPEPPVPPVDPVFDEQNILGVDAILGPLGSTGDSEFASNEGTDDGDNDSDDEEDSEDEASDTEVDVLFSLINTAPVSLDEMIDEPVTSGGDSPGGQ